MDKTFLYKVGLINWEVVIGENEITVKGWGGQKIIKQDKIIAIGIADDVRVSIGGSTLRIGEDTVELGNGPKGLIMVYEAGEDQSKKKGANFTFDPKNPLCLEMVEQILQGKSHLFKGIDRTHLIRAKMGLGGGDFLLGLLFFGIAVAIVLIYLALKR